jgi:hypothetical protein
VALIVRTQDKSLAISNLLDETYILWTIDNLALFQKKTKYVYDVLKFEILRERVNAFFKHRRHKLDSNKSNQHLNSYLYQSSKENINSSVVLSYIKSLCLCDDTW